MAKLLARQDDLPIDTVRDVLVWCQTFSDDLDAVWRFGQLGKNVLRPELTKDVISTAEAVLPPIVKTANVLEPQRVSPTMTVFLRTIQVTGCDLTNETDRVRTDTLFTDWVRRTDSFSSQKRTPSWMQNPVWVLKIVDILRQGHLDVERDRAGLEGFLGWLNLWEPQKRGLLRKIIEFLRRTYPQTDIWDIVELPPIRFTRPDP